MSANGVKPSLLAELLFSPDPPPPLPRRRSAFSDGWLSDVIDIGCAMGAAVFVDFLLNVCAARTTGVLGGVVLQLLLVALNIGFLRIRPGAAETAPRFGPRRIDIRCKSLLGSRWHQLSSLVSVVGACAALLACLRRPCENLPFADQLPAAAATSIATAVAVFCILSRRDDGGQGCYAALASILYALAALRITASLAGQPGVKLDSSGFDLYNLRLLPVSLAAFGRSADPANSISAPTPPALMMALATFGLADSCCCCTALMATKMTIADGATARLLAVSRALAACQLAEGIWHHSFGAAFAGTAAAGAAVILAAAAPLLATPATVEATAYVGRLAALALQISWGVTYIRSAL